MDAANVSPDPGIARRLLPATKRNLRVQPAGFKWNLPSANSDTVFVTILPEARVLPGGIRRLPGQTLQLNAQDLSGSGFNRLCLVTPPQGLSNPCREPGLPVSTAFPVLMG